MNKRSTAGIAILAAGLLSAASAAAEIRAELAGGYSTAEGIFAGVQAGAAIDGMKGNAGYKLSAGGEATYASGGEASGEANAAAQGSLSLGQAVILGSAEGGAYSYAEGSGFTAGAGLSLTLNGDAASARLAPRFLYDSGPEGYSEIGALLGGSMLLGSIVLKPEADIAWTSYAEGGSAFTAIPSLGLSWYPGIPLSASIGAGFERSWSSEGGAVDSIPAKAALYGAIGGSVVWRLGASMKLALADLSILEASAKAEAALSVARWDSAEIELPIAASWDLDEAIGFSATAGIRLLID